MALLRPERVGDWVARLGGRADPSAADAVVERVREPSPDATPRDLVVLVSRRRVPAARQGRGVVLCAEELGPLLVEGPRWVHPHVWWVVAQLLAPLGVPAPSGHGLVGPGARVDPSARVAAGAIVEDGAVVGRDSVIGHNAVVHRNVVIGQRVEIGASSVIGAPGFGWTTGPDGATIRIPQLGGVRIEDDVSVGCLCTVDAGTLGPTILRRGVRLDAHVHVGHNVELGPDTHVAAQSGFGGSSRVGARARIGGQAGVSDHVVLGDGVRVAAKSGVIGEVRSGATVVGFPAVDRVRWLRAMARLLSRTPR